ncbi:MAG: protein kinase domain-containing protein [Bryobacteraceae bacterium]
MRCLILFVVSQLAFSASGRLRTHAPPPDSVAALAQAGDGSLLLLTNHTIYRFNGETYDAVADNPIPYANWIGVTPGALWVANSKTGIAVSVDFKTFRIAYSLRYQGVPVTAGRYLFFTDSADNNVVRLSADGATKSVPLTGDCQITPPSFARGNQLFIACLGANFAMNIETMSATQLDRPQGLAWFYPAENGWIVDRKLSPQKPVFEHWRNQQPVWRSQYEMYKLGRNGEVWVSAFGVVRGLSSGVNLPVAGVGGETPVLETSDGHLWIAQMTGPLVEFIPDPAWESWPHFDFNSATPAQFFRNTRNELIAVTEGKLYRLDESTRTWHPLSGPPRRYAYVLELPGGDLLSTVREGGVIRLKSDGGQIAEIPGTRQKYLADDWRAMAREQYGTVLLANKKAIYALTGDQLAGLPIPGIPVPVLTGPQPTEPMANPADFATDPAGRLWVGASPGLLTRESNGQWRALTTDQPVRDVRSFAFRSANEVWVAHRAKGYFSQIDNGKVRRFEMKDGYGPARTYFLKVDKRGWIWRGTETGVYVSNGTDLDPDDWLHFETPGEVMQYGFFEDTDGSIWIASEKGITHVRPTTAWFARAPGAPRIAGNDLPAAFDPPPRNLQIRIAGVNRSGLLRDPIRYRLTPGPDQWRTARNGRVDIADPPPGNYRLEIRDMRKQDTLVHEFRIGPRKWYGWPLANALIVLTAAWALWRRDYLRYRMQKAIFLLRHDANTAAQQDWSGRLLKQRYKLITPLAEGGFSNVYEAIDQQTGDRVAVKVITTKTADAAWVRTRFTHEVTAAKLVSHPNVIQLSDAWLEPEGEGCLAFPYIDGRCLREALPIATPEAAGLIVQLGDAIAAIHAAGITHRDIKPENIMWDDAGKATLIDFGSSGLIGAGEPSAKSTLLTGSIEYLAPERLTGHYSPASDIYSFALVVYELLSGEMFADANLAVASDGLAARLAEMLGNQTAADLLAAALSPDPARRPTDPAAWAREIAATITTA